MMMKGHVGPDRSESWVPAYPALTVIIPGVASVTAFSPSPGFPLVQIFI